MLLIAAYQVPRLLRDQQWKELFAFALVWLSAGVYALLFVMGVPLPTVVEVVTFINELLPLPFVGC
ncbi:MAG: hypothetical protein AB1796_11975 [Bacillota bacterium]